MINNIETNDANRPEHLPNPFLFLDFHSNRTVRQVSGAREGRTNWGVLYAELTRSPSSFLYSKDRMSKEEGPAGRDQEKWRHPSDRPDAGAC